VLALAGIPLLTRAQWRHAAITGTLMIVGGNGLVMWAAQSVSSGFTAILVALVPVWFALLEWLRPNGRRPHWRTVMGIIIGFIGIALLLRARGDSMKAEGQWFGAAVILVSGILWAAGSLYAKHHPAGGSPWMMAAGQMLCGGVGELLVSVAFQEPFRTDWSAVSARSLLALGYLTVAGSWIAYSAYVWLLKNTTPEQLSTYAYVNPIVAVLLGWLVLDERVNAGMIGASAVILSGVAAISIPASAPLFAWRHMRFQAGRCARFLRLP
jgi:drug/metabolite transporter (DMT)-like permease